MTDSRPPWRDLGPAAYLESYRPQPLSAAQWTAVREPFLDLVMACEPVTALDASTLASSLARFLQEVAPDAAQPSIGNVTEVNVARVLASYEGQGMSAGTRGQHRARLNRFLKARAGLPASTRRRAAAQVRPADPYADSDLTEIVALLGDAPPAVRMTAHSALVLSVVYGVLPSWAADVSMDLGGLRCRGRILNPPPFPYPVPLQHVRAVPFSSSQWVHARQWMAANLRERVRLHELRLRDTWLLGAAQHPLAPVSLAVLMSEYRIGRCAVEQAARHPGPRLSGSALQPLRDF